MPEVKIFTPQQANQMLPLVRKIVDDILKCGQDIRSLSVDSEKPEEDPEINRVIDHLDELFDEIESLGCFYKDWNFSLGLVDFPAVIGGKDVFLCWRNDEVSVTYYHDHESGFAGRKLIPNN